MATVFLRGGSQSAYGELLKDYYKDPKICETSNGRDASIKRWGFGKRQYRLLVKREGLVNALLSS